VSHGPADSGKRDPRVSARSLDDEGAGPDGPALVRHAKDVEGHPVLHAAGHIEQLALGEDPSGLAAPRQVDGEKRRVADDAADAFESGLDLGGHLGSWTRRFP
jgi:hypothetical protein